jgi:hypothetical protein
MVASGQNRMSFIFLSHSAADDSLAGAVRAWLVAEGHQSIFLDHYAREGIVGGEPWEERLYTELRRCRALLALVSPEWLASPWCIAEANHAQALRKPVIPLRIRDVDLALYGRAAPPGLRRVQVIDWQKDPEASKRLRDALIRVGLDPKDLFVWSGDRDPYPGFAAFDRADAPVYFGREQEITDLLSVLDSCRAPKRARLIIVQGASGAGKSSLIRAGILPRLERNPDHWIVVPPLRPLRNPLRELADVIAIAAGVTAPAPPAEAADGSIDQAAWVDWIPKAANELRRCRGHLEATVVLTVDQLEEALRPMDVAGNAFLLCLRDALAAADHRLLALATLRADFAGQVQRHAVLREPSKAGEILATRTVPLGPMPRSSFHTVIEGPATLARLELEPGLTSQLVDDTGSDDALPLLAFVLRDLWMKRGRASLKLTRDDYGRLGGMETAIGNRADQIFSELEASEQEIAAFRTTLLRMADLSPDGSIIRRSLSWAGVPTEARRIIDAFATARLLVTDEVGVEVAHEALFRRWKKLANWIKDDYEQLRLLRQIRMAAAEWNREGRRGEFLWPDKRLMQTWAMIETLQPEFSETEQSFVRPFDRSGVMNELDNPTTSHERRASIGDYLARNGDPRQGVGLDKNGLPDIVWCEVAGGEIGLEGVDGTFHVERFQIAKYPVTWVQYRAFLDATDGYSNPEWWILLAREIDRPGDQYRRLDNHPAENVSWYDAVAFCRWLSSRCGYQVRLPTEWEWQRAGSGDNIAAEFPWGNEWTSGNANTAESGLNRTIAVGMYVQGASPIGALDLSGNTWEWCLNEYLTPERVEVTGDKPRVVRGGSFFYKLDSARTKYRDRDLPTWRNLGHGFRVAR